MKKISLLLNKYSKKQLIIGGVVALVLLFVGYSIFGGSSKVTTVAVVRGSVVEEVLVTGKAESKTEVNLAFQSSGKVVESSPDVGTAVNEGQLLARLDQSDLYAKGMKIDATIAQAQVELDSTIRKSTLSNGSAQDGLVLSLKDSYAKSDNAIKNVADQFFLNPQGQSPQFRPSFVDSGLTYYGSTISDATKQSISENRTTIGVVLDNWSKTQSSLSTSSDLKAQIVVAHDSLNKIKTFLDKVAGAINMLSVSDNTYNLAKYSAVIDGYKSSMASAGSSVLIAESNLIAAEEKYNNAPQLVTGGGQTFDDVLISRAKLDSLKADKALNNADLSKTVLYSPIDGIITKSEAKRGEIVAANGSLITVMSENKLQIKADVSEINISKISVGNSVSIVFDAIPNAVYQGRVLYIDPSAVLIGGVATYKVTVSLVDESLTKAGSPIRSGLTANLKIISKQVDNVLKVPAYAIEKKNGASFVKVISGKAVTNREVTTGLHGKDGTIEVVSGLSDGEIVEVTATP